MTDELANGEKIPIRSDVDIVIARQKGRALAAQIGFTGSDLTVIATAVSEIARNIVSYAGSGEIHFAGAQNGAKRGISIIAHDEGPGIPDVALALQDGYTTGKSLGLGLPGAKRLMDEFEIESSVGNGTTIKMKKWVG